jgi:predicted dehydrogenase
MDLSPLARMLIILGVLLVLLGVVILVNSAIGPAGRLIGTIPPQKGKLMNVAIIGCGNISQSHIAGWQRVDGARITVLCDPVLASAREKQQKYGLQDARITTDLAETLQSDAEAVSVCAPTALHAEVTLKALRAGKHVLCEKPMAMNAAEARRMVEAARASGKVLLIDHRYLYDPLIQAVLQNLDKLGKVFWFRIRSGHALPLGPGICKTGCLLDMGYHPLYTALEIMGPAVRVSAFRKQLVRPECSDDNGLVVLEHAAGMSILESSFSTPGPMGCNRPVEVYGSEGVIIANWFPRAYAHLFIKDQKTELPIQGTGWNIGLVQHFATCIRGDAAPISGPEKGLATMELQDRVAAAAQ